VNNKQASGQKIPKFSLIVLFSVFCFSFFGHFFYSMSPYDLNSHSILLAPSFEHFLGTDRLGRDLLARLIQGGQVSLIIGVGSAFIASFIGLVLGSLAGYFRGSVDKAFVITVDLFLTFPTFFLLLALVSYVNASMLVLIVIISITGWMTTARLIRSESFKVTSQPYIKILNIAKVSKMKILFKYYAPILAPIYFVSFTFGVGGAILAESGLSFLGLGIVAPQMSWGTILSGGKDVVDIAWWVSFFPGLMIFLVTFSLINISNYLQTLTNQKEIQG
jgi:peptide/nickel transport system permease protein